MKLIISKDGFGCFVYQEDDQHFGIVESKNKSQGGRKDVERFPHSALDRNCIFDNYSEGYMVFELAGHQPLKDVDDVVCDYGNYEDNEDEEDEGWEDWVEYGDEPDETEWEWDDDNEEWVQCEEEVDCCIGDGIPSDD